MGKEEEPSEPEFPLLHILMDDSDTVESMDMVLEGIQKHGLEGAEKKLKELVEYLGKSLVMDCSCGQEKYAFVENKGLESLYRCPCGKETTI